MANPVLEFNKDTAIQLLDLKLDRSVLEKLEGTFQETRYIQQFRSGKPTHHHLHINPQTNEYAIINPNGEVVPPHKAAHIYSFAIVTNPSGALELRLGLGNHYYTSGRADYVKAAGDIHFLHGKITKITNQSGGYHININDPLAAQKQASSIAAMKRVGLPIEVFVAYKPEPILFSSGLKRVQRTPVSEEKRSRQLSI